MSWLSEVWRRLKMPRRVRLGPVAVVWRLARHVRVSSNRRRRRRRRSAALTMPRSAWSHRGAGAVALELAAVAAEPLREAAETALIVGAGPGLGHALAQVFAAAGMHVALVSRNAERLDRLCLEIGGSTGTLVRSYGADATDERSLARAMDEVVRDLGSPRLVVYAVQYFELREAIDVEVPALEHGWRTNCLGGFITAREAARRMLPQGSGTILLVGSTSGMVGREKHLMLSVGKFGLRSLSQVLARELGPRGIHVTHVVVDADIQEEGNVAPGVPQALPEELAAQMLALHRQPRSCWTSEADFRPHDEKFWQHC